MLPNYTKKGSFECGYFNQGSKLLQEIAETADSA